MILDHNFSFIFFISVLLTWNQLHLRHVNLSTEISRINMNTVNLSDILFRHNCINSVCMICIVMQALQGPSLRKFLRYPNLIERTSSKLILHVSGLNDLFLLVNQLHESIFNVTHHFLLGFLLGLLILPLFISFMDQIICEPMIINMKLVVNYFIKMHYNSFGFISSCNKVCGIPIMALDYLHSIPNISRLAF